MNSKAGLKHMTGKPMPRNTGKTAQTARQWEDEIFYQVFPRSFYDSNNDSIGDFGGIEQKLDYL